MEKYNGWIIDEDYVSHSDSKVVLRAKIIPNIEEFYSLLKKKGVVSVPYEFLSEYYLWKSFNGDIIAVLKLIDDPTRQVQLYYKMQNFARNYKYGLNSRSRPTVVLGPCPQYNVVSSGKLSTTLRMEFNNDFLSPPGKSYRPTES